MNLLFTTIEGVEIGREKRISKVKKAIEDRKKLKKELEERFRELCALANAIRHSNPVKARVLDHRGITLANEAYRMKNEDRQPMTYDQIRRSALLGKCALLVDGEKK